MKISTIEQYAVRAFADALDAIPLALSENSGLPSIESLGYVKVKATYQKNTNKQTNQSFDWFVIFFLSSHVKLTKKTPNWALIACQKEQMVESFFFFLKNTK